MRSFAKKLACVLASAAMVVTMFPAAKAQAAAEFGLNATEKILYVNAREDATYNKQMFDFNFKKAPKGYLNDYTFAWATSDDKVATVKAGGIVTAVASGVANITCVVTNKETKEQVTVSAKVTVRENAKEVVISNAAKYEDTAVGVGEVVDLNRTMITADGRKTSGKRTTTSAVTDRTMWVAEPSEGVEINQSNGKFTFTDKAEAGTYKLSCYTYQSAKHPEKVAVSEPVTVEFTKDIDIDVTQNTVKKFTVNFGSVITADINKSVVSVVRLDKRTDKTYEFPCVVKSVDFNKTTGKSATVELFTPVIDKAEYAVTIKGVNDKDPYVFVASNGTPTSMKVSGNQYNPDDPLIVAGAQQKLYFWVYDANNVELDVNAYQQKPSIFLSTPTYSADYYVTSSGINGNQVGDLYFAKAGLTAEVKAEYHSLNYVNGTESPAPFSETFSFTSIPQEQYIGSVVGKSVKFNGKTTDMTLPIDVTNAVLVVKVRSNGPAKATNGWGGGADVTVDGQQIDNFRISFEETSQDVLALEKTATDIKIVPYKEGVATIVVNMLTPDANGAYTVKTPIDVLSITVTARRRMQTVTLSKPEALVSDKAVSSKDTITFTAKDQYGDNIGYTVTEIIPLSENAKTVGTAGCVVVTGNAIKVDSSVDSTLLAACGTNNSALLQYQVKVSDNNNWGNVQTLTFQVRVQKAGDAATAYTLEKIGGVFSGENVARYTRNWGQNEKALKYAEIGAFQMNNGVKFAEQNIVKYSGTPAAGTFSVKVLKDGQDVTSNGSIKIVNGNVVRIEYTTTDAIAVNTTGSAVSGAKKVVTGGLGAGNYSVLLFNGQQQVAAITGAVTYDQLSYGAATRKVESVDISGKSGADLETALRNCFDVPAWTGNTGDASGKYVVDYNNNANNYVYVSQIRFYEEVETGVYVEYVVPVGVSLKK